MYWTGKSMNNLLSYCGLIDLRISASDKDLPVPYNNFFCSKWWIFLDHFSPSYFCQKHLFLHQLTQHMTKDYSLNYEFSTWKMQSQNMLCAQIFVFVLTFRTICVQNKIWHCFELGIFMHWNGNSMDNLLSYCGLIDARISTSESDFFLLRRV